MRHPGTILGIVVLLVCTGVGTALSATKAPDSKVNPVTGFIEIGHAVWNEDNHDIEFVIDDGSDADPELHALSNHLLDDLDPRTANASNGDSWVVWWRDGATDQVLIRKRTLDTGVWSNERQVSDEAQGGRSPVIAHDGSDAWVAFEYDDAGVTGVGVQIIIDEPDPIGVVTTLGTTGHSGAMDVRIYANQGNLWVTWVDSGSDVAWSEYDVQAGTWRPPVLESYANDSVGAARFRIRSIVVGN